MGSQTGRPFLENFKKTKTARRHGYPAVFGKLLSFVQRHKTFALRNGFIGRADNAPAV